MGADKMTGNELPEVGAEEFKDCLNDDLDLGYSNILGWM